MMSYCIFISDRFLLSTLIIFCGLIYLGIITEIYKKITLILIKMN